MSPLPQTPSQTVGPFFHYALTAEPVDDLDPKGPAGEPIVIEGSIRDGAGAPTDDAMIEVWQSDGDGRYHHPADRRWAEVPGPFIGFGRVASEGDGSYRLRTVMPGPVPAPGGSVHAPHLNLQVFARGLLDHLVTRVYFQGHEANARDPVLSAVLADRRHTLLAQPDGSRDGTPVFRFDIVLQGEGETVFFDA